MDFTNRFKLKGNTPKINTFMAELTIVIKEGSSNEEILDIESRIKELADEDVVKALKNRKNYNILEDERPSKVFLNLKNAKKGYIEVILLNKENPIYDPTKAESDGNTRLVPIMDRLQSPH